ncbi:MAG TPA: Ig-like domain repeat protein [Marmoricola sp.]|nr:Ig-like domain repeat protein [Marmoricola sp.]
MKNNRGLMRATAAGSVVAMTLVAAPALAAKPVKPGPVSNLTFSASAPAYHLASTWTAGRNATAYQVRLVNAAGKVLDSEKVTTLRWSLDVTKQQAPVGSTLKLSVTSYSGKQKSSPVSRTLVVPDVTAPSGSYDVAVTGYDATLTQTALSDDSGAANVTRSVSWGDGETQPWASASDLTHSYLDQGTYQVVVTLTDQAGNTTKVTDQAKVVDNAPTGTFEITQPDPSYSVTVTQTALSDDITAPADLTRVIDWGDGSVETMTSDTASHQYPDPGTDTVRYTPTVTITDTARPTANSTTDALRAVVVNDHTAPTGSFTLNRTQAWASYTKVKLTQTALDDGAGSPAAFITRSVDWGDGSTSAWTSGTTLSHRYSKAGSFTPSVTLTDEAGNTSAPIPAGTVAVSKDSTAPKVTLQLPTRPRYYVKKWRSLRGHARDAGVGVRNVKLQAVEKRGGTYYAYRWSTHRWVKVGSRLAPAWKKAGTMTLRPTAKHAWSHRIYGVRKGILTYRVRGIDRVGNTSKWLNHSQKLTR